MGSATESALINTLETPLPVAWVWVCYSEVPSVTNFAGGVIVMAAVAGHAWRSSRWRLAVAGSGRLGVPTEIQGQCATDRAPVSL